MKYLGQLVTTQYHKTSDNGYMLGMVIKEDSTSCTVEWYGSNYYPSAVVQFNKGYVHNAVLYYQSIKNKIIGNKHE